MRCAPHITTENFFKNYCFDGRADFFPFDARAVIEAEHAKNSVMMDRKKGTHLRKAMQRSW